VSDIVKRLRESALAWANEIDTRREAAADIERLRGLLREARAVIFYAFNDESANEPHNAGENLRYMAMLASIDAALHDNGADVSVRAAVQPEGTP
jgi:hypothetical protein